MITLYVRHIVLDYPDWRKVFDEHEETRKKMGQISSQVLKDMNDGNDVTLVFEWEDKEKALAFMHSADLNNKMKEAGVIGAPEIRYLEED